MAVSKKVEEDFQVDPEDIVLLILEAHERLTGKKLFSGITRLEKLVFLLQNETSFCGIVDAFSFRAYNYGPFSKEVYEAVEFLEGYGFIKRDEKSYSSIYASAEEQELTSEISDEVDVGWETFTTEINEQIFSLTDSGRRLAFALYKGIEAKNKDDVAAIDKIVASYASVPLRQLIRYVYRRYPDMTEKSIHPEAARIQK